MNTTTAGVEDLGQGILPTARVATIEDILENFDAWESTLVQVNMAEITGGSTFGDANEISDASGTFRDLTSVVTLDYSFPNNEQLASDNAADFTGASYVFDELALVGDNDALLTHLIFHPIQKSQNRKLEIRYTLRITAGS